MTTITEKLRSVAATIRTKPTALSDFIPLLGQVADHIDKLEAEIDQLRATPAAAPEQAFVCSLGCTDECVARAHGVPSECPSLPRQPATAPATTQIEDHTLDRLIDAWDSTVLPKSRDGMMQERMEDLRAALAAPATATSGRFKIGDHVFKVKGSQWSGRIVGWYSTDLTPIGWAVESFIERGSVQIYPDAALELIDEAAPATAPERPNPYDACESFKAYQLSCRREAVLQKEIERLLAAPATAPDRHAQELLAMEITLQNMRERHAQEICAYELTVQNLRDQIASAPAWHDAPTVPGLWVVNYTQQTRPIHNTELVIEELRDALAAPATAPERPNPYDACESFKAYQLSCRREAVLQKEIERLLAAPATAPAWHDAQQAEIESLRWTVKDALESLDNGMTADCRATLSSATKETP